MENELNIIVAAGNGGVIGRKGDLIWHISDDLKRFKRLTTGHPVIMGRKTWESLPKKPLPGRRNIVVTRDHEYVAEGAEVVSSPQVALETTKEEEPFVIGGGEIYRALMPYATTIHLTAIKGDVDDADTFIDIPMEEWETEDSEGPFKTSEGMEYSFLRLRRRVNQAKD